MKLLIVDDDFHVIEGIRQNLSWEVLSVDEVFSALGAGAARQIMKSHSIDIIICDIEMPQETGLDFAAWVREEAPLAQIIFLTSYAKFEYAKRAITLGSCEYILKPVDYSILERAVAAAADRVQKVRHHELLKENNYYWETNKNKVAGHFWSSIISGASPLKGEAVDAAVDECGLSYIREMVFLPVVIQWEAIEAAIGDSLRERVCSLCGCSFSKEWGKPVAEYEFFGSLGDYCDILILKARLGNDSTCLKAGVAGLLESLSGFFQKDGAAVLFGVGMWSIVGLIYEDIQNVLEMMYEAPRPRSCTLYLDSYAISHAPGLMPDLELWAGMLKENRFLELKSQVKHYLTALEHSNALTGKTLQQLGMDITQLVYAYLDSAHIYAHMLFDNEENNRMYGRAALSSEHMLVYLDYLLDKSVSYKEKIEQAHDLPDRIKNYIDSHFQENISREALGRLVFLNPDYLSRMFKRKMGISISGYLIQKRIDAAKELLVSTKIPVSVISSQVGYDNFAYFTKIFREKVGMAPNEYRKNSLLRL